MVLENATYIRLGGEHKEAILGKKLAKAFNVIGFTDDWKHWWHVHNDEEVPENWMLKPS